MMVSIILVLICDCALTCLMWNEEPEGAYNKFLKPFGVGVLRKVTIEVQYLL